MLASLPGSLWRRIRRTPSLAQRLAEEFGSKKEDSVEFVYWSPGGGAENFGDYLSVVAVTKILADAGLFLTQAVPKPARLLAIGSILHMARDGDTIWGSGVNGLMKVERHTFTRLDVRAVRGPRTRDFLMERSIEVPEVYGDPALLFGHLLPQWHGRKKTRRHVFVPNIHDLPLTRGWPDIVSPFQAWNRCFDQITSSEFVMASSLHGLIIAETYGIPARYVRLTETEGLFKYEDHFLGTGRRKLEFARTIDEALEMGGMAPPKFDAQKLLAAFPFDLWGAEKPATRAPLAGPASAEMGI